jgi:lipoyl(octanoyl) transferase
MTRKLDVMLLGRIDYKEALDLQEKLLSRRQSGEIGDTLLILEHPPVITLGRRGLYSNVVVPKDVLEKEGVSLYEVNRGGDVTYHGPGQIVGYPIIHLGDCKLTVKDFVGKLEEVFITLLAEKYGIEAHTEEKKYTGVWVGGEKITAIGIEVKRRVTMHGFAFNVNTDLDHFKWINPSGITDKGVTSLQKQLGYPLDMDELNETVAEYFCKVFDFEGAPRCTSQNLNG